MRRLLFLSLSFVTLIATAEMEISWYGKLRRLSDDTNPRREEYANDLKKMAPVICKAVKDDFHQAEAIEAITRFDFNECWPEVFTLVKTGFGPVVILAANRLATFAPHPEWRAWVEDTVFGPTWKKLSGATKMVMLDAVLASGARVTKAQFKDLLKDKDSDVRVSLYRALKELPVALRRSLASEINNCVAKEFSDEVRDECVSLQKSL